MPTIVSGSCSAIRRIQLSGEFFHLPPAKHRCFRRRPDVHPIPDTVGNEDTMPAHPSSLLSPTTDTGLSQGSPTSLPYLSQVSNAEHNIRPRSRSQRPTGWVFLSCPYSLLLLRRPPSSPLYPTFPPPPPARSALSSNYVVADRR